MTKPIILFLLIVIMTILKTDGIYAISDYGNFRYGVGLYGINTPPTIQVFQPLDVTLQFNITTNTTFNITAIDKDNDVITLEWFVNDTFNTSNENLTYIFNTIGIFNITANVSDAKNNTLQSWLVTIINDTAEAEEAVAKVSATGGGSFCNRDEFLYRQNCLPDYLLNISKLVNDSIFRTFFARENAVLRYRLTTVSHADVGSTIEISNIYTNEGDKPAELSCINFIDEDLNAILNDDEISVSFSKRVEPDEFIVEIVKLKVPSFLEPSTYAVVGKCEVFDINSNFKLGPDATAGTTLIVNESKQSNLGLMLGRFGIFILIISISMFFILTIYLQGKKIGRFDKIEDNIKKLFSMMRLKK